MNCPICQSPAPHRHPAVQHEGEVQPCRDPYHLAVTPENTPERIAEAQTVGADATGTELADLLRRFGDVAYKEGCIAGVNAYAYSTSEAWAENGVQYVGRSGTTRANAVAQVEQLHNYSPPSRR